MAVQKIHTVTEADWSFTEDHEAYGAVLEAGRRVASRYSLDVDDCQQDALMWASVRPKVMAKHITAENYTQLTQDCYSGLSQVRGRQLKKRPVEVSYEELFGEE